MSTRKIKIFESVQSLSTRSSDACISGDLNINAGTSWPMPMANAAFYGLPGKIVADIEPHTEADNVALLIQLLAAFGNKIGRTSHFIAEGTYHYLNLFCVLAGATSKGRKGTSWGRLKPYLQPLEPDWLSNRVRSGLASGEGMIYAIRDPVMERQPFKDRGKTIGHEEVEIDAGENDKRLFCIEEEYPGVLKMLERQGNSLSARLREAWQGQPLGSLTKNSPTRCQEPHISIVGHVTIDEVRRYLTATEMANGFGNRHLWMCVRRSKLLPEGSSYEPNKNLIKEMQHAAHFAQNHGELRRDEEARDLWHKVYGELSEGKPGLVGAMLGRAEAQVMRVACLYAVLDQSPQIKLVHLEAALAVWDYSERSVRIIFGDSTGDCIADEIVKSLRAAGIEGMTRKSINDLFQRNRSAAEIRRALAFLQEHKLARPELQETGGRPAECWHALMN